MKLLSIWLRFMLIIPFVVTGTHVHGAEEENIALEAKVEVSSIYNETYVGENAIDGNNDQNQTDTRWLSGKADAPGKESDPPHWLILDFGKPMAIVKVNLYFYVSWAPVEYIMQYEKGGKWVDIPETRVENAQRDDITKEFEIFAYIGAQRLRFYCTDGSSYDTTWGNIVRLSEIEVYSTGPAEMVVGGQSKLATTWGRTKSSCP
jgi:hypothetical protein